ncbi:uncharacterized protein LOC124348344 [Daphnia pulicaria]|uniref:uncharacterized protein LOC124348344 n=1 Tax=Daphnia pulicaria TaxID=35523 RepID=UPI001EEBEE93|nr:uncharacterized protein LOC124348344 [Daphnia pulicaria]
MPHTDGAGQKHKQQPHHHHGQQKHLVPRRRNTDIENAALSKRQKELMRERRILIFITFLCFLASILWIVSLSTDFWIIVDSVPKNNTNSTGVLKSHLGVWRGCITNRQQRFNESAAATDGCSYHNLEQDDHELRAKPSVARTIIDYRRTIVALAGLSLLCHIMSISFSMYTFRNPRYTFKRLAGCMHLITAATTFVLIEVVSNGADFSRAHLLSIFPEASVWYHGFSFYLAWYVCFQYGVAGLTFLICSRKRKSLNIMNEDGTMLADDEYQVMGRM